MKLRTTIVSAAALAAAGLAGAGCAVSGGQAASATTPPSPATTAPPATSAAPATTAPPAAPATTATTAPPATSGSLPISVSTELTSADQDASVLAPISCAVAGGTVTAQGTVSGGVVPETYRRYGDVVELYAYTTAGGPSDGVQVLDLASETPGGLGASTWTASAPIASGFGAPVSCFVAVQSTHAFMGAGNAGG